MGSSTNNSPISIVKIYKQAIANVPILKYSWVLIATVCILALAAFYKLDNADVFFYAIGVIIISFFAFLFSYLLKIPDAFIKWLLRILITCIVVALCVTVLGLASYIIWGKPEFYNRWFQKQSNVQIKDSTKFQLKSALAELSGKKRALAKLLEMDADKINIHTNDFNNDESKWDAKPLFRSFEELNEAYRNLKAVVKKLGITLDYNTESRIYQGISIKSAMHASVDNQLHKLALSPPQPEDFRRVAQQLRTEAEELDKLTIDNVLKDSMLLKEKINTNRL
ncbi:MAG TPA: FUSC family protein [Chitinophagaceae bacterium]